MIRKCIKKYIPIFIIILCFSFIFSCANNSDDSPTSIDNEIVSPDNVTDDTATSSTEDNHEETYKDYLYTPTQIKKIGEYYFIVDCWQGRVIYSKNLDLPIYKWSTLTDGISGGHTIASDDNIIVIDDSGHGIILIYSNALEYLYSIQVTGRPHFVTYDKANKSFYVLTSDGRFYQYKNENNTLLLVFSDWISYLRGNYTRSFTIIDSLFYFATHSGKIYVLSLEDNCFSYITEYYVNKTNNGLNMIEKIGEYYYVTIYTNPDFSINPGFIRTKNLENLSLGIYEDIYELYSFDGVPYFFSYFDDKYYLTEIDIAQGISSFNIDGLDKRDYIYYKYGVSSYSATRKKEMSS